jgi:hypothetical protein
MVWVWSTCLRGEELYELYAVDDKYEAYGSADIRIGAIHRAASFC